MGHLLYLCVANSKILSKEKVMQHRGKCDIHHTDEIEAPKLRWFTSLSKPFQTQYITLSKPLPKGFDLGVKEVWNGGKL